MLFVDSVVLSFRRYVDFAGRSRRAEYWWFVLFGFLVTTIASRLDAEFAQLWDVTPAFPLLGGLSSLVTLALVVPSLAVAVRRLHDLNMSGWWLLIGLVPFVGAVILVILFVQPGAIGPNRFGPDPRPADTARADMAVLPPHDQSPSHSTARGGAEADAAQ